MPHWYWPSSSTVPTWITTSATTSSIHNSNAVWFTNQTATTSNTATTSWYLDQVQADVMRFYQAEAQAAQNAYERYNMQLYRPTGLMALFRASRPAILTHREELLREQEAYRRAVGEHDEQEAARILRQIEWRETQIGEQRRIAEEQRERAEQDRLRREAAKARARELLVEHLTPEQRATFDVNGWFVVEGGRSKTKYRIRALESMVANVDVLDRNDRKVHRLCGHVPTHKVPLGDQLLAQKIMIELAEDDFLRVANRHA